MENIGALSFSPGDRAMLDTEDSFRGLRCKALQKKKKGESQRLPSWMFRDFPAHMWLILDVDILGSKWTHFMVYQEVNSYIYIYLP